MPKHSDSKRRILYGFFRFRTSKRFDRKVRQWLVDEQDSQSKEEALIDVADRIFQPATTVSKSTLQSLYAVRERIGLPQVNYTITEIPEYKSLEQSQNAVVKLRRSVWTRVAAVLVPLLVIAGAATYFLTKTAPESLPQGYVAITAGQQPEDVTLPDGSQVTFSNGTLKYAENFAEDRQITLSGEAQLSVVADAGHPFRVDIGQMEVTVLGTKFSIRALDSEDKAEVVLAEGSVSVRADGVDGATVLKPGQRFAYDRVQKQAQLSEAPREEVLQAGGARLEFENKSVEEILMTVGLYFNVDIEIERDIEFDNDLVVNFAGDESLDDVMFMLQTVTGKFDYAIKEGRLLITKKK